jgi:hypothetical protein
MESYLRNDRCEGHDHRHGAIKERDKTPKSMSMGDKI